MSLEIRKGDLFESEIICLAQGVNCFGFMGAGIAREFARRWPQMKKSYEAMCKTDSEDGVVSRLLGGIHQWPSKYNKVDGKYIFNLFTQFYPGADARLSAIESSVNEMLRICDSENITEVAMPKIGCGIGGLNWEDVKIILEKVCTDYPDIKLVIYEL